MPTLGSAGWELEPREIWRRGAVVVGVVGGVGGGRLVWWELRRGNPGGRHDAREMWE
jgi:hypothetical protein